jgi:LmbE family N-acetylglucosaminyl deacetylase
MRTELTLMAVHAHPDDEAIGTGGILARAADEGIRTVLVTCTNGELGDAPGGITPDESEHDTALVVAARREELQASCDVLGIAHLELLGYHDSGMMGWPQNDAPHAFWNTPVDVAAKLLVELFERYRPDVVVTYDENGFYGHPDHIQANRITLAAARETGLPRKLYYTAVGRTALGQMAKRLRALLPEGEGGLDFDPDDPPFGVPDDTITTIVDVSSVIERKRSSIAAHHSQIENIPFLKMPDQMFLEAFGRESFVRVGDTTGAPLPEDDLFAGLR